MLLIYLKLIEMTYCKSGINEFQIITNFSGKKANRGGKTADSE